MWWQIDWTYPLHGKAMRHSSYSSFLFVVAVLVLGVTLPMRKNTESLQYTHSYMHIHFNGKTGQSMYFCSNDFRRSYYKSWTKKVAIDFWNNVLTCVMENYLYLYVQHELSRPQHTHILLKLSKKKKESMFWNISINYFLIVVCICSSSSNSGGIIGWTFLWNFQQDAKHNFCRKRFSVYQSLSLRLFLSRPRSLGLSVVLNFRSRQYGEIHFAIASNSIGWTVNFLWEASQSSRNFTVFGEALGKYVHRDTINQLQYSVLLANWFQFAQNKHGFFGKCYNIHRTTMAINSKNVLTYLL